MRPGSDRRPEDTGMRSQTPMHLLQDLDLARFAAHGHLQDGAASRWTHLDDDQCPHIGIANITDQSSFERLSSLFAILASTVTSTLPVPLASASIPRQPGFFGWRDAIIWAKALTQVHDGARTLR